MMFGRDLSPRNQTRYACATFDVRRPPGSASDAGEALKSPLMGIFEKRRMKSFIEWIGTFDINDPVTHKGEQWGNKLFLDEVDG